MKIHTQIFIVGFVLFLGSILAEAQEIPQKIDTTQFKVEGVCDMCKSRIENAALVKGVKFVEWDKETRVLTTVYRTDKVSSSDIEGAIAESGHDTENIKSEENAYIKLPDCCAYRNGVQTH